MSEQRHSFVLIDLVNRDVVGVLGTLRQLLGKRQRRTNIHVTLQGPYGTPPEESLLLGIEDKVRGEPLLIAGVGRFRNGATHVVYLKVSAKFLRALWWKPDYPIDKFGFNPHVTIYEGENEEAADLVFEFLKKEKIELLCFDYAVHVHDRRRPKLIVHAPFEGKAADTVRWGRVKPGLLLRAAKLSDSITLNARQHPLF